MNQFEMVVMIVLIACAAGAFKVWAKTKAGNGASLSKEQEQRVARLEQRVQALEAVVTDHGYDLKKQFRELESK